MQFQIYQLLVWKSIIIIFFVNIYTFKNVYTSPVIAANAHIFFLFLWFTFVASDGFPFGCDELPKKRCPFDSQQSDTK